MHFAAPLTFNAHTIHGVRHYHAFAPGLLECDYFQPGVHLPCEPERRSRARTTLASENDARERERQPAPREHSTSLECETSSAPLAASVVWVPRYSHAPRVSAQGRGGGARKRGSNAQALCHATPERGPDLYEMLLVQIVDLNIIPFLERKDAPSSCGPGFARRTPHFGTWTPRKNGARHGSSWQPGVCNV